MPAPTGTWQPDGNAAGIARTRVAWPKSSTIVPARTSRASAGVRSVRRGGRGGRACRRDRGDAHGGATHAACGRGRRVGWRALRNAQGLLVVSNVARDALILLDTRRRRGRGEQRG